MKNYTTQTNIKAKDITLEDIKEAVEQITPVKRQKIEVSKKGYQQLRRLFKDYKVESKSVLKSGDLGALYGLPVYIKPYLKKLRIVTYCCNEHNKIDGLKVCGLGFSIASMRTCCHRCPVFEQLRKQNEIITKSLSKLPRFRGH